jgi:predicted aldo/keto reductase-like oxidoreductase
MQLMKGSESDRVQRNGSRVTILSFGNMNLPTLEVDLASLQSILLVHPHPGVNG